MAHFSGPAFKKHKILIAVLAVWALEAGMNALYGYNWGSASSRPAGILYGGIFLAFAFIGAWLGVKWLAIKGWDTWLPYIHRLILGIPLLGCITLSQITGWSVLGITIADGGAARENKAQVRTTRLSQLDQARKDRAKLGDQRDPKVVAAEIDAKYMIFIKKQSKTIRELTNECKEPDWAPSVCKEIGVLTAQLRAAESAKELDAKIEQSAGVVDSIGHVSSGQAETNVLQRITGATDADIKFWISVFIVAMIGLFANLGFTLAGFADPSIAETIGGTHAQPAPQPKTGFSERAHNIYASHADRMQSSYPFPVASSPPTIHHHYPPTSSLPPPPNAPVNVTVRLDGTTGKVENLRPPLPAPTTAAALEPEPLSDPRDLPRFLQEVESPSRPFYVKILTHLQIRPDLYLNLSGPCRVLANTSAMAFQRYVRTLPTLNRELQNIEVIASQLLHEVANIMIADIKSPDDHEIMVHVQDDIRRHLPMLLLLPHGPYERGMVQVVEDLERTASDPRALDYIKRLRHAVVTNPRANDVDWRTLYQALQ